MPTIKVQRNGSLHCFHCNAPVNETDSACPQCGQEFRPPAADRPAAETASLTERMKHQAGWQVSGRGYIRVVLLLGLLAIVLMFLWPARKQGPVLPAPASPRPEFRLIQSRPMPSRGIDRLTLVLGVEPGLATTELQSVIDWALFEALSLHNRQQRHNVRVVWLYVVENPDAPISHWRAMAIWADERLPQEFRPAGIGGDSRRIGEVEYDFTNPLLRAESQPSDRN